jgi:hypothetical protein
MSTPNRDYPAVERFLKGGCSRLYATWVNGGRRLVTFTATIPQPEDRLVAPMIAILVTKIPALFPGWVIHDVFPLGLGILENTEPTVLVFVFGPPRVAPDS